MGCEEVVLQLNPLSGRENHKNEGETVSDFSAFAKKTDKRIGELKAELKDLDEKRKFIQSNIQVLEKLSTELWEG